MATIQPQFQHRRRATVGRLMRGVHRLLVPGLLFAGPESFAADPPGAGSPGSGAPVAPAPAPAAPADLSVPDPRTGAFDDAALEADGAVIGNITVVAGDIFNNDDPAESNFVFRVADRVHVTTRDRVILRQLAFREGDRYDRKVLDESERLLRHAGYFYDASIRPVARHGNVVDVEVRTRDVWTLKAGIGFGRSGGTNKVHFGLHDANFLGLGKSVELRRSSNVDRTATLYGYRDPALFGSHTRLDVAVSNNSDGQARRFALERPFWSLDTNWAAGIVGEDGQSEDTLYALGHETDRFGHDRRYAQAYVGWSPGRSGRVTHRFSLGFTYAEDRFSPVASAPAGGGLVPPDHTLGYPWIAYDSTVDRFVREHDRDKIGRTEDVNLGSELHARLGYAAPAFGADRSAAVFDAAWSLGLRPGPAQTLLLATGTSGRIESDGLANGLLEASARYDFRTRSGGLYFAALTGRVVSNLDPENQLLLGGDNGLRGYPLRYALGDRAVLLTLERRWYRGHEYFHLFRAGAAVFADVGKAWGGPADAARGPGSNLGLLKDVGVGLRFGQSRSAHASIIRVDLAFPLDGDPSIKKTQFLVSTAATF